MGCRTSGTARRNFVVLLMWKFLMMSLRPRQFRTELPNVTNTPISDVMYVPPVLDEVPETPPSASLLIGENAEDEFVTGILILP